MEIILLLCLLVFIIGVYAFSDDSYCDLKKEHQRIEELKAKTEYNGKVEVTKRCPNSNVKKKVKGDL